MTAQNTQTLMAKIQLLPINRIAEVEDFVDFLNERTKRHLTSVTEQKSLNFPVDHLSGAWQEGLNLSREDLYGNDGR